jgi:hypothetical protein
MLCKTCENLPQPTNVAGSCKKCGGNTAFFAYKLCSDCSEALDQCERCEVPLKAGYSYVGSTGTAFRIVLADKDDQTGIAKPVAYQMRTGDEIIVQLEEDQYGQTQWGFARKYGSIFRLKNDNGFTPYPGQWQKGTRELVIEVTATGTEDLVLTEMVRTYSYWGSPSGPSTTPAPNGKTWQVAVQAN